MRKAESQGGEWKGCGPKLKMIAPESDRTGLPPPTPAPTPKLLAAFPTQSQRTNVPLPDLAALPRGWGSSRLNHRGGLRAGASHNSTLYPQARPPAEPPGEGRRASGVGS